MNKNWDDLKFCLALHRHKSMLDAAKSMKENVATVSRRIERLTEDMGETLFVRRGPSWEPTGIGKEIIDLAREVENRLGEMTNFSQSSLPDDSVIRMSVSIAVLQTYFSHCLENPDFKAYGSIDISYHPLSLAYAETDLAVGYTRPENGHFVCAKLGHFDVYPYIVPEACGDAPSEWIDIIYDDHKIAPETFGLGDHLPALPQLRIDGLNLTLDILRKRPAVAFLPDSFAADHPDLRKLDMDCSAYTLPIWLSYHQSRKLDPIVRKGVEFVRACFTQ
ncbi:LysR family transcriptional regulator [Pseudooctadecabacter sp.]|uniref:LysR family transcriptional regulator n=1 Tax=Pseudooctadecabacter sp. TaxID=1966338 RepID=UPI0035C8009D